MPKSRQPQCGLLPCIGLAEKSSRRLPSSKESPHLAGLLLVESQSPSPETQPFVLAGVEEAPSRFLLLTEQPSSAELLELLLLLLLIAKEASTQSTWRERGVGGGGGGRDSVKGGENHM